MCFLPDEHGPCRDELVKWFYDSRDGICKQFRYGGCASNGNKFESREECEYRCGEVQGKIFNKSRKIQKYIPRMLIFLLKEKKK